MFSRPLHRRPIYFQLYSLAALEFIFGIIYGSFSLSLPILSDSIFLNVAVIGGVFALPELFGMFFDIPIGAFAARFGRKKMIFCSALLLSASAVLFLYIRSPLLFLFSLIFYEFSTQSFIVPSDAAQVALTPNRRAGRFNGFVEGLHNLGFAIGPVVAGLMLAYSIQFPFYFNLILGILMSAIVLAALPFEKHREPAFNAALNVVRKDKIFRSSIQEFKTLGFAGFYLVFIFFIFALHWGFLSIAEPLYTNELGFSNIMIGLIFAGFTLPIFFISALVGRYIDIRGAKGILSAGVLLMALSTLGFALAQNPWILFLLSLVAGVGDALLLPAVYTMLDKLSSYHGKERISGVKIFSESSGYFLGPLIAGALAGFVGFSSAFWYFGLFIAALAGVTIFIPLQYKQSLN